MGSELEAAPEQQQQQQPERRGSTPLAWSWVAVGVAIIVGGCLAARYAFADNLAQMVARDRPLAAAGVALGIPAAIFFAAGMLVARLSPGLEVKEPALASLLSVAILDVVQYLYFELNVFAVIVGTPLLFASGYLGGWIGERWLGLARAVKRLLRRRSGDDDALS